MADRWIHGDAADTILAPARLDRSASISCRFRRRDAFGLRRRCRGGIELGNRPAVSRRIRDRWSRDARSCEQKRSADKKHHGDGGLCRDEDAAQYPAVAGDGPRTGFEGRTEFQPKREQHRRDAEDQRARHHQHSDEKSKPVIQDEIEHDGIGARRDERDETAGGPAATGRRPPARQSMRARDLRSTAGARFWLDRIRARGAPPSSRERPQVPAINRLATVTQPTSHNSAVQRGKNQQRLAVLIADRGEAGAAVGEVALRDR